MTGQWAFSFSNSYVEACTPAVPAGTEVQYTITATPADQDRAVQLGPFRVMVATPQFALDDAIGGHFDAGHDPFSGDETAGWIAFVKREAPLCHVRVDLDDISSGDGKSPFFPALPCAIVVAGERFEVDPVTVHAQAAGVDGPQLPLIDWAADRVVLSVWADPAADVVVNAYGATHGTADHVSCGTARVLMEYFGIQNYNDLLESPFSSPTGPDGRPAYRPARTYMQITMRDDLGTYSSRPDAASIGVDGYSFGFDAHRRFDVPYELALNGGVLGLIGHDCVETAAWLNDDLATIVSDVAVGLLHPTVAGFGSHRVNYYSAETNRRDILECVELQKKILGASFPVFYPDSRLYQQKPGTTEMFEGTTIEYMVLDGLTGYENNKSSAQPNANATGLTLGSNLLWQDVGTGKHILFINDDFKDKATSFGSFSCPKPDLTLRRWFIRNALDPRLAKNLLVFGDDFEKLCGNGWFEGDGTHPMFFALLEWMSADRPWLRTVTSADLDPVVDCVGTIDVRTSTDPDIGYSNLANGTLYYDTWYKKWSDYEAFWTGGTLGGVTAQVETALQNWPDQYRNELFETAWLAFLAGQHENAFNKQVESENAPAGPVLDPEDFCVVEGLQIRNVFVWLSASVWAKWASEQDQSPGAPCPTFVNGGLVHDRIATVRAGLQLRGCLWDADHWDADPLETYTLYNRTTLVVLDRNGGCAPFAFVWSNGRPRTVSGTFKSYQYLSSDNSNCDGPVIQNTVWTPNHRYLGSDLALGRGQRLISWADARSDELTKRHDLLLPFNFDAYEATADTANASVTMSYTRNPPARRDYSQDEYTALLRADGDARRQGTTSGLTVWHDEWPFTKTFHLEGSRLTVTYVGAPSSVVIDNEVCVDLLAGVRDQVLLTREPAAGSVTIRSAADAAVRIGGLDGCAFTDASLTSSVADALRKDEPGFRKGDGNLRAFLQLHRVLTEAVQLTRTASTVRYEIDFIS